MADKGRPGGNATVSYSLTIMMYLTLNSSLNIMNKYVLGMRGFHFPLFLTVCHMGFSFVVLLPVMMLAPFRSKHHAVLSKQWKGLCAIGAFLAANIALNNISLVHMSLSLNQIIRSSIPVVTALLAVPVEGKVPSRFELGSLLVLVAGVMLSVWEGTASGSVQGIVYCCIATVSNAAMMTFSGKILSERLDVLRLTFYTAPVSCLCLLPFFYAGERVALSGYLQLHAGDATWIVLVTSANALAYNAVHYRTIQITSAVTTTVLGMLKIIGLLLLSALLLGEGRLFTLRLAAGCALAVAGFAMYSYARLKDSAGGSGGSSQKRGTTASPRAAMADKLGGGGNSHGAFLLPLSTGSSNASSGGLLVRTGSGGVAREP